MSRQTARQIDEAAAQWAARVDAGVWSVEDEAALKAWLAGDVRRLGAFARVRAVALHTERAKALGPQFDPARFVETPIMQSSRRRFLVGGAIAAGAAGLGVLGAAWLAQRQVYSTRKGETRVLALKDGSVVTLNTDTKLAVSLTQERRVIRLLHGEGLFEVAKDKARPFIVHAGEAQALAVGTSFTVQHLDDRPMQVLVREGVVEVRGGGDRSLPVRLTANMRALSQRQGGGVSAETIDEPQLNRELAWRDGRISFSGETLERAAGEFARYSDTRIVIDDPALGREEIAGLFQANDPVGFAQAAAVSFNGRVQVGDGVVRISR